MTADPHHTKPGPGEPLYGPESASTPVGGTPGGPNPLSEPQTGAEDLGSEQNAAALTEARVTNQRLNLRAQRLESELAAYRKAVAEWEIGDQGTYVPLRTLSGIAKAAGLDVPERWELHYQRVEEAEAAIARVREVCDQLRRASVLADGEPHTARERGVVQAITRVLAALDQPAAHDGGPSVAEAAADDRVWPL